MSNGGFEGAAAEQDLRLPALSGSSTDGSEYPLEGGLGDMLTSQLLWLWQNPGRSLWLLIAVVTCNGLGQLILSRPAALARATTPGAALLVAGTLLVVAFGSLLERERRALGQWASQSRSLSSVFAHKALVVAALALLGAAPLALGALSASPSPVAALPWLSYGSGCVILLALFQTSLWLSHVSISAPTSARRRLLRSLQLVTFALLLSTAFAGTFTASTRTVLIVFVLTYTFTCWQGSVERLPYVLEQHRSRTPTLTATFALLAYLATSLLQWKLQTMPLPRGWSQPQLLSLSFVVGGLAGIGASVGWLAIRGVPRLREHLGLTLGNGLGVTVREGVLWSLPAVLFNMGYWKLFGERLLQSPLREEQPPLMQQLAPSPLAMVLVGVVAAPLIEELLFRGMLYRSLRRGWGVALSLLVSTALFTVNHPLIAAGPIFCVSVCMTLAFERSRSLYAAMLVHALYNGVIVVLKLAG